ncbi:4-coumarate--CoA ligase 1-like protein, partial [Dinothrombium tinctorium]
RVLTAGSRLPAEVAREFINKYKISQLVNCYGITEAGGSISFNTDVARNYNSVGKVIAGVQVKVVNPQTGALLGENEEGELWVKTYNAFKGYYNNSELVSSIIDSDGWIHSGDIGYYDENEELYVIDRMKDIIKQSGFGYSPVDVEEVLLQHKDVREAAVVGIPDADEGEISHAFVVLKEGVNREPIDEECLKNFVNERVSALKQIKGDVHIVNELPKTPLGKILRQELRSDYLNNYNCV